MKFSVTSDEFFTDLKEKTGFKGSLEDLKKYTKEWLKDTFIKSIYRPNFPYQAFPCHAILFLNKYYLECNLYPEEQKNYIPTLLKEEELINILHLWREGEIEDLINLIDGE